MIIILQITFFFLKSNKEYLQKKIYLPTTMFNTFYKSLGNSSNVAITNIGHIKELHIRTLNEKMLEMNSSFKGISPTKGTISYDLKYPGSAIPLNA